jgi:hypothetical protein
MNNGWVCPVCGYTWAIWVEGCKNCNRPEHEKSNYNTGIQWPYSPPNTTGKEEQK